jgi:hypothetical protein
LRKEISLNVRILVRRFLLTMGLSLAALAVRPAMAAAATNLIVDGSFEETMPPDQFGHVFKNWSGWKYEGACEFRVGQVAHRGKSSCLLFAAGQSKIRVTQTVKDVPAGRYKLTAWIRGLDIGEGEWHNNTEFQFDGKYTNLKKNGTFGWTPLTYVVEIKQKKNVDLSFGLWASGYFWIDDVSLVAVGNDVALTAEPIIGVEEKPLAPPGPLGADAVRCPVCGYRNNGDWRTCYACGAALSAQIAARGPATRSLASFEDKNPFSGGTVIADHASDGAKALRLDKGYAAWDAPQDWSGYDYLKADLFSDSKSPISLHIEMRDSATKDYWTRLNYETMLPPGKSTLVLPLAQLYVGEKARPGRKLLLNAITQFVLGIDENATAPIYIDNLRLDRDTETAKTMFKGLSAYSFGPPDGPLMPGFTRVDPSTVYSVGRGYGLKNAQIFRASDVLQPEPLYENFIAITGGGFSVDLPNGRYHVFVNIDNPSGFWGEYQYYRQRTILAQGEPVVQESMTFDSLKNKYFRYWNTEDLPTESTFDKYQRGYYQEKEFDVDVKNGQLNLDFRGDGYACSVSAVVIYPVEKAEQARQFLNSVVEKRRFFFDNYFHRILHEPTGDALAPTPADGRRGYIVFSRDYMQDVYYNDTPRKAEIGQPVTGFGFAGQHEPITVGVCPLMDLGKVSVSISDLTGPGTIPADRVALGYVSYRITRVSSDGAVYTITPRLVLPRATVAMPKSVTRRFWLTVHPADDTKPGLYHGKITITPERGEPSDVAVEYRVYPGTLDPIDVPVGPYAHEINIPWDGSDPVAAAWNHTMAERSLIKLHDYGFTSFSGMPIIHYLGFKAGKPQFDFTTADEQMKLARRCGFTMPVVTYTEFSGLNLYYKDDAAMQAAGFTDYSKFIRAIFSAIQQHADAEGWLPVYWNIADEPVGDDVIRAGENAAAYRAAFPKGPPFFTGATSFDSAKADDPHFAFAKALHVPDMNGHNEPSIEMIHKAGSDWAFYNNASRWTYGIYMYKAVKQFDMKFRLGWHWHAVAGDPYYALDCREDDYAWCNANSDGELIPSVDFERQMRAGIDDYRMLLTLARLAREKHDAAGEALIASRMSAFKLGQTDHDAILPASDWRVFRRSFAEAIARLRQPAN